jgi:hypothetical protein
MDLALPSQIVFNFRKRMVYDRLDPPQFFTLGVQHNLLPWVSTRGTALNSVQLVWPARISRRHFGEHDGWRGTFRPTSATAEQ